MRILKVSGEGIRSLTARFDVDFTTGLLAHGGLFAIVGPTGSGKSTLLDVICLALYGRVPRVPGKVGGVRIADGDDSISESDPRTCLSQGAGEARAEVEFALGERRFRATWRVHRARKKPEGKLQPDGMELTDLEADKTLANKKKDVEAKVIELTGLDFDQFQRSVLLAQGQFARFLQADERDRAELLETITGQTIYARLSMAAYRRAQALARERDVLLQRTDALELPTDEEYRATEAELDAASAQRASCEAELASVAEALRWYRTRDDLSDKLQGAEESAVRAGEAWTAFVPTLALLQKATLARELRVEREALRGAERRLKEAEAAVVESEKSREAVAIRLGVAQAADDAAAKRLAALKDERERLRPALEEAMELDRLLGAAQQRQADSKAEVRGLAEAVAEATRNRDSKAQTLARAEAKEAELVAWFGSQVGAAELARKGDLAVDKLIALEAVTAKREVADREVHEAKASLASLSRAVDALLTELDKSTAMLAESLGLKPVPVPSADDLDGALQRARERAATEEQAANEALRTAERLEPAGALRSTLVEGEACPVCGATDHPAAGLPVAGGELDRLKEELAQRREAVRAVEGLARQRDELERRRRALEQEQARLRDAAARLERGQGAVKELAGERETLTEQLEPILGAWRATWESESPAALRQDVEALLRAFANREQDLAQAREQRTRLAPDRAVAEAAVAAAAQSLADAESRGAETDRKVAELHAARAGVLEGKSVEAVTRGWQAAEQEGAAALDKARRDAAQAQADAAGAATRVAGACEARDAAHEELDGARAAWNEALERSSLPADEVEELLARGDEWFAKLSEERDQLREDVTRTASARDVRRDELARHEALDERPTEERAALEQSLEAARARQVALEEAVKTLFAAKRSMDALRITSQELVAALEKHDAKAAPWTRLSDLIGSADGSRFRKFAQGLALLQLLDLANAQMVRLKPRYRIQRVPGTDLEIAVVDRHQANQVRPVSSLSGGETFLVSLGLALGLAQLTGGGAPLQSLFIDEGFGSLDQETLDDALDALERLQSEGKTIGIISHVEALRERIASKITITPSGAGRSELSVEL